MSDVVLDGLDEFGNAAEGASADSFVGEFSEEALDQVQLARISHS